MAKYQKMSLGMDFAATVELTRPPNAGKKVAARLQAPRIQIPESAFYRTAKFTLLSGTATMISSTGAMSGTTYGAAVAQRVGNNLSGTVTTAGTITATVNLQAGAGDQVVTLSVKVGDTAAVIIGKLVAALNRVLSGWTAVGAGGTVIRVVRDLPHLKGFANVSSVSFSLSLGSTAGLTTSAESAVNGAVGTGLYLPADHATIAEDVEGLALGSVEDYVGMYVTTANRTAVAINSSTTFVLRVRDAGAVGLGSGQISSSITFGLVTAVSDYADVEFTMIYTTPTGA